MPESLVLDRVTKVFRNGTVALRDLSLSVAPGQFFVFLGPSGCGKTTLLRAVAGLEHITEGRIFIAGRDVTDTSPKERDVAMVFQNYSLYPHMTVYDNIAFGVQATFCARDPARCRAASSSASPWGAPSCASRRPSSWTNRSPT